MSNKVHVLAEKAFILVSFSRTMLKDIGTITLATAPLALQCDRAMKGYHNKVGTVKYFNVASKANKLYLDMQKNFKSVSVTDEEIRVFIEILLNLIPHNSMKEFILMNFKNRYISNDVRKVELVDIALDLDEEINKLLGTEPTTNSDKIHKLLNRDKKVKESNKSKKPKKSKKTKKVTVKKVPMVTDHNIKKLADKYGLSYSKVGGTYVLSGNEVDYTLNDIDSSYTIMYVEKLLKEVL